MFLKMPREVGMKRKLIFTQDELLNFINTHNGYSNVWVSLYSFGETTHKRGIYDSALVDKIYFDIDGDEAYEQLQQWNDHFKDYRRLIFFSGGYFNTYLFPKYFDADKNALYNYHREVFKDLGLKCKDTTFWGNLSKIVRVHGTYNVRRGRYCMSLAEYELGISMDDMRDTAKWQRRRLHVINKDGKRVDLDPYKENRFVTKYKFEEKEATPDMMPVEGIEVKTIEEGMILPCLVKGNHVPNPTHPMRYFLVAYLSDMLREGEHVDPETLKKIKKEIYAYISKLKWRDFNPQYTYKQISHICDKYHGGVSCQNLKDKGYCTGKCWRY